MSRYGPQTFESDYQIRALANSIGLYLGFGPTPSIDRILADLAHEARKVQALLPMKGILPVESWNFVPVKDRIDTWHLRVDNPRWKDNALASTSYGVPRPKPRMERMFDGECLTNAAPQENVNNMLLLYDREFAVKQILLNLHPAGSTHQESSDSLTNKSVEDGGNEVDMLVDDDQVFGNDIQMDTEDNANNLSLEIAGETPFSEKKKRKARAKTPIADEVRRPLVSLEGRKGKQRNQCPFQLLKTSRLQLS